MTDVVPLNPSGWSGELEQLGEILRGEGLLLLALLSAQQFKFGIALHKFD